MPIVLVHLKKDLPTSSIFKLCSMFYISIKVECLKNMGPSQCFLCQRFGHRSSNCHNSPRCVKCSDQYLASQYSIDKSQKPTCCNCGGSRTANYRGCPFYQKELSNVSSKDSIRKQNLPIKNVSQPPPVSHQNSNYTLPSVSYANAVSNT